MFLLSDAKAAQAIALMILLLPVVRRRSGGTPTSPPLGLPLDERPRSRSSSAGAPWRYRLPVVALMCIGVRSDPRMTTLQQRGYGNRFQSPFPIQPSLPRVCSVAPLRGGAGWLEKKGGAFFARAWRRDRGIARAAAKIMRPPFALQQQQQPVMHVVLGKGTRRNREMRAQSTLEAATAPKHDGSSMHDKLSRPHTAYHGR